MNQFPFRLLCVGFFSLMTFSATAQTSLEDVIEEYESYRQSVSPSAAAEAEERLPSAWPDVSQEARTEELKTLARIAGDLKTIETEGLSEDGAINLKILKTILEQELALLPYDEDRLPFTGDWGFHASVMFGVSRTQIRDEEGAEATIARIEAIPAYLEQNIENMRRGLETGFVSYDDPLDTVLDNLEGYQVEDVEESDLYAPFISLPDSISDERKADLRAAARKEVGDALEAFARVEAFLRDEYAPNTREGAGIADLPKGKAYYEAVLAFHTTRPDLTPEDVHETGKREVARIRAEMDEIIEEVGFEGSFDEFLTFLRTDEQFYAKTPEALMERAARLAKDIDYQLPKFFGHMPRLPYGVEPVPASIAPGYTTGRLRTYKGRTEEYGTTGRAQLFDAKSVNNCNG